MFRGLVQVRKFVGGRHIRNVGSWVVQTRVQTLTVVSLTTCAGLTTWAGVQFFTTSVHAKENVNKPTSRNFKLPSITLYQYETCPFCTKIRTFLDYYGIEYTKVEVHPIFKREIGFSDYRKVPIVIVDDEIQINDSSFMVSVLQTAMLHEGDVGKAMEWYPKAKHQEEDRANKYWVMYGDTNDLNSRREEREWREWVDTKLIHVLAPNIYQTPSQSVKAFRYIGEVSNFNIFERYLAQCVGPFVMYFIAKKLKKKYEIQRDVRQAMYNYINEWMKAIGKNRKFLGGDKPNLADLAVYSVLRSTEGLDTFNDVMSHTEALPWYQGVQDHVNHHRGNPSLTS